MVFCGMAIYCNDPFYLRAILTIVLMFLVLFVSVYKRKLTPAAGGTAFILGMVVMNGTGFTGIAMMLAFFAMGVAATAHKRSLKRSITAGAPHTEERTALQVLANGGVAGICSLPAFVDRSHTLLYVFLAAGSLASAAADTLSSELGTVYGKRFVNVLTGKKEARGLDGVISLEGTVAGIAGAFVIASIFGVVYGFNRMFLFIVIAGFIGNLFDSILGATLERRRYIGNNLVNALNTAMGAIVAWLLQLAFG